MLKRLKFKVLPFSPELGYGIINNKFKQEGVKNELTIS